MEKVFKRFLSLALALLMVISYVPTAAFAAEVEPEVVVETTEVPAEAPAETQTEAPTEAPVVEEIITVTEEEAAVEAALAEADDTGSSTGEAETVTLTIYLNGGVLDLDEETKALLIEAGYPVTDEYVAMPLPKGEEARVEFDEITREGYTMTGVVDQNGNTYAYGETFTVTEDTAFYIQWEGAAKVATKAELDAAIAAAEAGDTILLTADIDYGTDQLKIEKAITLDLGGNTLTTGNNYGGTSLKNGPSIVNGTISHVGRTAAIKAWNVGSFEDLTITVAANEPGKVIGGIVIQEGTDVCVGTIKNVTIKGEGLTNGIETYNCGNATKDVIGSMENVTIDAKGTGMLISAPCGKATDCTINGGVSGIEIWIKGTYSAKLELADCDVTGGTQAVYAHDEISSDPDIENKGYLYLTSDGTTFNAGSDAPALTKNFTRAKNVILDVGTESGTITTGYAQQASDRSRIYGDIVNLSAAESVVIKLYSGETLLATTELANESYFTSDPLTYNIVIGGRASSSWNTVWEEGHPVANVVPDKVVLYVDGTEMNSAAVTMGTPDDLGTPAVWAELQGVAAPVYPAYIGETGYESLEAALNAAKASGTATTITLKAGEHALVCGTMSEGRYWLPDNLTIIGEDGAVITNEPAFSAKNLTVKNVDFVGGSYVAMQFHTSGDSLFEECKIDGPNGTYYSTASNGTTTFKNCTVSGLVYGLHVGEGSGSVVIDGCDITGWNSYGVTGTVTITGSKLHKSDFGQLRFYQTAYITDTIIDSDVVIDADDGNTITFTGCETDKGDSVGTLIDESTVETVTYIIDGKRWPTKEAAAIGETKYPSIQAAVNAAQAGDTITVIADVTDEAVTVDKSVTITGDKTLNNVSITASGTDVELSVSDLTFTGASYINANNAAALTVTGVEADVTPSKIGNNGRAAFIVTGTQELNDQPLKLTVTDNKIVSAGGTSGDFYAASIFGWRYLADGSVISGNTLGSEDSRATFVAVKLMNAMPDATITLEGNTVYGTAQYWWFNGFDLYQNNSRANTYTVISENNIFDIDPETNGEYYAAAFYLEGNGGTNVILLDSGSTVNGEELNMDDVDDNDLPDGYNKFYGVGVAYDESGKYTAGTFGGNMELVSADVAQGYKLVDNGDGTWTVQAAEYVAQIGDIKYPSIQAAVDAAQTGDTVVVLKDHEIYDTIVVDKNITIDLNGYLVIGVKKAGVDYVDGFRILADVTLTDNSGIDAMGGVITDESGYCIFVGNETTPGNLTIKNGAYIGSTTAVQVTQGTLTVEDGIFGATPYQEDNYNFVLNCKDAFYQNGTAKIEVKGGIFQFYNPGDNAAEGAGTNFVAQGYEAVTEDDMIWTVQPKVVVQVELGNGEVTDEPITWNGVGSFAEFITEVQNNTNWDYMDVILYDDVDLGNEKWVIAGNFADVDIRSDGDVYSITSSAPKTIEITCTDAFVEMQDVNVINTASNGRAVDTRTALELNLEGVTLTADKGNSQALTIGGDVGADNRVQVNIDNSVINAGDSGYGIITFNPVDMEVTASQVSGFGALYMKAASSSQGSAGSNVSVIESTLATTDDASDGDSFGAIVFEDNNITLTADEDSVIDAENSIAVAFSHVVSNNTTEGSSVVIAGTINAGTILSGWDVDVDTFAVKAEYADQLKAEDYTTKDYTEGMIEVCVEPVAQIGETKYPSIQAAVDAAQAGDIITVIADVTGEAVTVDKSVTITGEKTLTDVTISGSNGCELTVSGLTFEGNSWINAGTASKLTVSGVTATDVAPANGSTNNSRNTFISLGASEQHELALVVENSKIYCTNGADAIIGWAKITSADISGNTFGSESAYNNNNNVVKIMGVAADAVITFEDNTVYANWNGFVVAPNTTRGNAHTIIVEGNTFVGEADFVWIETQGADDTYATVKAASDNTVNGNAFTAADIKTDETTWYFYGGVDVETDAKGKLIGGTFNKPSNKELVAEGYTAIDNDDGTWTIGGGVAQNVQTGKIYSDVSDALKDAESGETVILLKDAEDDLVLVYAGTTFDLNGKTLTADNLVGFNTSNVADNSDGMTGLLKVGRDAVVLSDTNTLVPVWNGSDGYVFIEVGYATLLLDTEAGKEYQFLAKPRDNLGEIKTDVVEMLQNGATDNAVKIIARLTWNTEDGTAYQDFVFTDDAVSEIYTTNSSLDNNGLKFYFSFTNYEGISGLKVNAVFASDLGPADSSNPKNIPE